MNNILNLLLIVTLLFPTIVKAQIDTVIVEKYYISDVNDAIETSDGVLQEGSVTYRVFVKLAPGIKLKSIYGDQNHAIKITSTDIFYNNAKGKSFGKDISPLLLKRNTVALDTWLTLGLATSQHTGVLKNDDPDTSILGGTKNMNNMLINNDILAGRRLINFDGLVVKDNLSRSWNISIDNQPYSSNDTTIFNNLQGDSVFSSNSFSLTETSGSVYGIDNKILVAQLTTKGDLRFELNLEAEMDGKTIKYVAKNALEDEVQSNFLVYPYVAPPSPIPLCGCPDANYLEYNPDRDRDVMDSCKTRIVLGCMEKNACNYNPEANVSDGLCCYPGKCANRDISLVCPGLGIKKLDFTLFPNPTQNQLNVEIKDNDDQKTSYAIIDPFGKERKIGFINGTSANIDISDLKLTKGLYLIRVYRANENASKVFMKE